jgi:secreted PhoX family phosphatase
MRSHRRHHDADGKTLFVGIQHPGEDATAANPTQFSNWPQPASGRPVQTASRLCRAAVRAPVVVVITKDDGGIIGA